MINLINKILEKKNISDTSYFYKYVTVCNIFNMCFNLALFFLKIICSYISNSSVIAADAYSDLVDVLSTLISIYALWIAHFDAGKDHPFGHGRLEWLAGALNSFLLILVGINTFGSSMKNITGNTTTHYSSLIIVLLLISVLIKFCMWFYNLNVAKKVNSSLMQSIAVDCISDGLMTSCILFSIFLSKFTAIRHADIWIGFIVSMFIIVSAYRTLRRIANRIIGLDITPKFANDIENLLKVAPFDFTVYDLVAHDYGLQRMFISMQLVGSAQSESALSYWAHQINIDLYDKYGVQSTIQTDILAPKKKRDHIECIVYTIAHKRNKHVVIKNLRIIQDTKGLVVFLDIQSPSAMHDFEVELKKAIIEKLGKIDVIIQFKITHNHHEKR
ncbi:cation diffusion facilitator family transporter [Lactiplantibacillus plantarum]|uniref:cation diffusion facilitator family transporter n=1 Tax=Lactiplantibacillus plantarum TaxID=1590 RepID=UPI000BEA02FD|nr:cation diffusion facilitator family transporter [Lactiplantibacillus plantarum]MCF1426038.1 cation transporter [Lactiplantibacillus plantarum]